MAKHIHIYFTPKRTRDQAPGSVPPSKFMPLVEALHQIIAERGSTADEQGRAANGQFAEGDRVKATAHYGGKAGHIESTAPSGHFHVVKHDDGTKSSYHESDLRPHDDDEDEDEHDTRDADFDESKVKRDEGGRFSAQQHSAKAAEHEAAAAKSEKGTPAHQAHTEAAQAHTLAAQHITASTGWAQHHSAKAMQASQKAAQAAGPASIAQLKATASNPKASVEERAAAVQQLDKMEKAANTVAASPHAVPKMNVDPISHRTGMEGGVPHSNTTSPDAARKEANAKHFEGLAKAAAHPTTKQYYLNKAAEARGQAVPADQGGLHPEMQRAANAAAKQPDAPARDPKSMMPAAEGPLGPKPTTAKSKGIKNQTHELLSSGHPFSLEELMKATGVQKPEMMRAYLADLKNPKYAAKAGALTIVKRPDGMYHVEKAAATPAAEAPKRSFNFNQQGEQNLAPSIANKKDEGSGPRTAQAPHYGGSTTGEKPAGPVLHSNFSASPGQAAKLAAKVPQGSGVGQAFSHAAARAELTSKGVDLSHIGTQPLTQQRAMLNDLLAKHKDTPVRAPIPKASPAAYHRKPDSSGTYVEHQPSGTEVPHASKVDVGSGTAVEHGSAGFNPLADEKAAKAKAVKAPTHTPVKSSAWGNPVIPGYTSHKSVEQPKGTHRTGQGKEVPASSHEVYHNGEHIGTVQSYSGYRDGPNIGGRVVAWRKDQVHYSFSPKGGAQRELSKHLYPATHYTTGSTSAAEAIRGGVMWHQAALARKNKAGG